MKKRLMLLSICFCAMPQNALAHWGHVGELAGHGHLLGFGALVGAAALAAALRKPRKAEDADTEADIEEEIEGEGEPA